MELYKKYRPANLSDVIGQPVAVMTLNGFLQKGRLPHTLLFSGPSGVGKTTIARILVQELGCSKFDCIEINAAKDRGIEVIREIADRVYLSPMNGKCKVWLIDECHHLTRREGGDAQTAFLKLLEDTPDHVYFFLATTNPDGLLPTIRTRATEIHLGPLHPIALHSLLESVLNQEKEHVSGKVLETIVEAVDGSARKALVLLDQIIHLPTEQEQLDTVQKYDTQRQIKELCQALLKNKSWKELSPILKGIEDEPEAVRRAVLGYMTAVLLSSGMGRAAQIIGMFEKNWFDAGRSSMVAVCWELCKKS